MSNPKYTLSQKAKLVAVSAAAVIVVGVRGGSAGQNRRTMVKWAVQDWRLRTNFQHWGYSTQPQPIWAYLDWTAYGWLEGYS